jgi:hypothetical protein
MRRRIVLLAAIATFALPATASAATRLVSPAGADAGDCTVSACAGCDGTTGCSGATGAAGCGTTGWVGFEPGCAGT